MTEYVVTRWYRAPELLLSCDSYTAAIDIWSVGCILAELLQRKAFFPGKDYIDQLKLIIRKLGSPSDDDLTFISSSKARTYIKALPHSEVTPFHLLCSTCPESRSAATLCESPPFPWSALPLDLFLLSTPCFPNPNVRRSPPRLFCPLFSHARITRVPKTSDSIPEPGPSPFAFPSSPRSINVCQIRARCPAAQSSSPPAHPSPIAGPNLQRDFPRRQLRCP